MSSDNGSKGNPASTCEFEPLILVTRGDELPKKNYEKRLHPTYETSIRIKNGGQHTSPHYVVKFYDQYRDLCEGLKQFGVGEGLAISIDATFPLKYPKSFVGFTLSEQQLQHRCYLLNKWMGAIFANYHRFPTKAQILISEFLSLNDNDAEEEKNKDLILALLRKKKETMLTEGIKAHTSNPDSKDPESAAAPPRLTPEALSRLPSNDNSLGPLATAGGLSTAPTVRDEKEVTIGGFLGVRVKPGSEMVRKKDDTKLHHSYETSVRLLTLAEAHYNTGGGKAEIDAAAYEEQVRSVELKVVTAFDAYRELRNDLQRVHVYSSDNPTESSAARQNGYKVIVIDAPFPPTLKMSALGVSLNEAQVQQRAEMINNWLGILLRNFTILPRDGKELITDFLGMPSVYSEQQGGTVLSKYSIIHGILRGTYVPPLKTSAQQSASAPKKTLISYFTRKESTGKNTTNDIKQTANAAFDVSDTRPVASTSVATNNNSGNNLPGALVRVVSDNESVLSAGDAQTDAGIDAVATEVQVGQFLGVSVMRGRPIAKKVGEKKTHPSYEILIRILPLEETSLPEVEKRKIDEEIFNVHVEAGPMRIAFAFDAYRTLKIELETFRVYSLDRKNEVDNLLASNPNDPVVLIDARFPRTYHRQSLGFKLNDSQLNQRSVMLNQWFGALMQSFNNLPFLAKEHVVKFLTATDLTVGVEGVGFNPTKHPRDAVILAMLRQTFTPELKKVPTYVPQQPEEGGKGKGKGKKNKRKGGEGEDDGYAPDGGCACTIM